MPCDCRFGCYLGGTQKGAIQFTGDSRDGGRGRFVEDFGLDEDPFDSPDTRYRAQMHEKQCKDNGGWKLYWKAEVFRWDSNRDATHIGDSGWYSEDTIRISERIKIPSLSGSRILIGAVPGTDGTVKVDRVMTNYWRY